MCLQSYGYYLQCSSTHVRVSAYIYVWYILCMRLLCNALAGTVMSPSADSLSNVMIDKAMHLVLQKRPAAAAGHTH